MSLYERIDRDAAPRSKETFEYLLVYAACFSVLLAPVALRRLDLLAGGSRSRSGRTIFDETRAMAANCATSSFMGL
jgi:hypothetical protein